MAKNNDNSLWKSWFGVGSARSSIFLMASIFLLLFQFVMKLECLMIKVTCMKIRS